MTKLDLLAGLQPRPVPFEVNGHTVHIRPLSAGDRLALVAWRREHQHGPDAGLVLLRKLVALSVCDPDGRNLLTEEETDAIDSQALDLIAERAAELNGMTEGDDAGKSSPGTPS